MVASTALMLSGVLAGVIIAMIDGASNRSSRRGDPPVTVLYGAPIAFSPASRTTADFLGPRRKVSLLQRYIEIIYDFGFVLPKIDLFNQ